MRDLLVLAVQLVVTFPRLMRPGGVRAVIAESLLLKHQLLISRSRQRASPLTTVDRFVLGLTMLFVSPGRVGAIGWSLLWRRRHHRGWYESQGR